MTTKKMTQNSTDEILCELCGCQSDETFPKRKTLKQAGIIHKHLCHRCFVKEKEVASLAKTEYKDLAKESRLAAVVLTESELDHILKNNSYKAYIDYMAKLEERVRGCNDRLYRLKKKKQKEEKEIECLLLAIDMACLLASQNERLMYPNARKEADKHISRIEVREAIFARDKHSCRHCRCKYNLTIDHIIPVSLGGGNETSNLQTLCKSCNSRKGNNLQ